MMAILFKGRWVNRLKTHQHLQFHIAISVSIQTCLNSATEMFVKFQYVFKPQHHLLELRGSEIRINKDILFIMMSWHLLYHQPLVSGIHQLPPDSPHKGPVIQSHKCFFLLCTVKLPMIWDAMMLIERHCNVSETLWEFYYWSDLLANHVHSAFLWWRNQSLFPRGSRHAGPIYSTLRMMAHSRGKNVEQTGAITLETGKCYVGGVEHGTDNILASGWNGWIFIMFQMYFLEWQYSTVPL